MLVLLDADIVSYFLRGLPPVVKRCKEHLDNGDLIGISSITAFELRYGIEAKQPKVNVEGYLRALAEEVKVFPFGIEAAFEAGVIRSRQAKMGRPSGNYDQLLAGHAIALNALFVTNNTKHFNGIPKLLLENWMN